MEGWIKLYRKIINWEWYKDNNTKIVFLHLLLTANHREKKWNGITIKRGQKLTSLRNLSKECNLSIQQVRTALNKLQTSNEIKVKTSNNNTLITINNYSNYQTKSKTKLSKVSTKLSSFRSKDIKSSLSRNYTNLENLYANNE